ncbi:MAG: hypothetical protein HW380_2331 [Magnetococcales bacterium]|nr:hypothetical protein [Magnetococcales bacterium]
MLTLIESREEIAEVQRKLELTIGRNLSMKMIHWGEKN